MADMENNQISIYKGLSGRAILAISTLLTVISAVLSLYFTESQKNYIEEELILRSKAIANNLAYNSQYWVLTDLRKNLQQLISGVMNDNDIVYAVITDQNGIVVAHSDTMSLGTKIAVTEKQRGGNTQVVEKEFPNINRTIIEISSPIEIIQEQNSADEEILFGQDIEAANLRTGESESPDPRGTLIGVAILGVSKNNLNQAIDKIRRTGLIITLGIMLSGIILTIIMMMRFVTRPLRKLMHATKIVAQGNLDYLVDIGREDEIGILARSFNLMTADLKKSREKIENWNKELETKVIERTKELSEKHEELTQYSEELKKAYEELKTLDKAKDDFLALVSHELRTPLSSIVAYTEVLLDDMAGTKDEEKSFLEIIKNESDRLTRLINNVLDLSKMEAGRMPFDFKLVELNSLVSSGVNGLSGVAGKRNQKIINTIEDSSSMVVADPDKIVQVVSNILSNAIKHTPEGGEIVLSSKLVNSKVQVSIADNGHGMPREDYDKVFDKFRQIEDVKHHSEGTGLGMPISKLIIENHEGSIWFESEEGVGTVFHFTLLTN